MLWWTRPPPACSPQPTPSYDTWSTATDRMPRNERAHGWCHHRRQWHRHWSLGDCDCPTCGRPRGAALQGTVLTLCVRWDMEALSRHPMFGATEQHMRLAARVGRYLLVGGILTGQATAVALFVHGHPSLHPHCDHVAWMAASLVAMPVHHVYRLRPAEGRDLRGAKTVC